MKTLSLSILYAGAFAALCFLTVSCGGDGKPKTIAQDTAKQVELTPEQKITLDVKALIDKQLASSRKVTNILGGYTFGMSKKEVEAHTEKMHKKGTLKKLPVAGNRNEFIYQFPLDAKRKGETFMEALYKQEHLYKLQCRMNTPKDMGTAELLARTKDHLTTLYGQPSFTLPSYNSCDHFLWIDGNMHIDLKCDVDGVKFVYTDLTEEKPLPEFDSTGGKQVDISDIKHKDNK